MKICHPEMSEAIEGSLNDFNLTAIYNFLSVLSFRNGVPSTRDGMRNL